MKYFEISSRPKLQLVEVKERERRCWMDVGSAETSNSSDFNCI